MNSLGVTAIDSWNRNKLDLYSNDMANEWALSKTTQNLTSAVYYPFHECYTFAIFLCRVHDILTGGCSLYRSLWENGELSI